LEGHRTRVLVRVGHERMTVAPVTNSSSSSAQITVAPSASSQTTSTASTTMQWQSAAALFSALSYVESTGSFSLNPVITNWYYIDRRQTLPAIYEREDPTAWLDHAKCQGLPGGLFYSDHQHNNSQVQEARSVCLGTHPQHPGRCPVLEACLDYAIENGERWGVWGGTSERERRRLARARRQLRREEAIQAGAIVPPPTSDRPEPPGLVTNHEAGDPTPWGRSKALIAAWRRERAEARRLASIGDQPFGLVSAS